MSPLTGAAAPTPTPSVFQDYPEDLIIVDLRPRTFGGTVIQQRGQFLDLTIRQNQYSREVSAILNVLVLSYATSTEGGYGELLPAEYQRSQPVPLVADNNCVIDLATGKPYSMLSYGVNEEGQTWLEQMEASGKQLMYQGRYFKELMDTKQVPITPMIIGFITDADDPAVNKFG